MALTSADLGLKSSLESVTGDSSGTDGNSKQSLCHIFYINEQRNSEIIQHSPTGKMDRNVVEDIHADGIRQQHCPHENRLQSNLELSQDDQKNLGFYEMCLLFLKCTGLCCYVFCCPPIPELITRKLAFHPLPRGKTYVVSGNDANGKRVQTNSAKKALKLTSLMFEPQKLTEKGIVSTTGIEITIIKTKHGSFLPILNIRFPAIHDEIFELENDLVVLFSQPNSSDLGCYFQAHELDLRSLSNMLQATLYAYDYSGYGISTGNPSEKNIYADIEGVYNYIYKTRGPNVRIALLGYSIGTATTIYMASQHPPRLCGVILVAPFASGFRLYSKSDRTCFLDRFLSYERAPEVNVPVLICHGYKDDVTPIHHSKMLLKRFPRTVPPFYMKRANHMTIFSRRYLSIYSRIRYFLLHETDPLQPSIT